MKALKKTIVSAVLLLGILAGLLPAAVFAEQAPTAQLVLEATSSRGEFAQAGDSVTVSLFLQNAGWAQKEAGAGWAAGLIRLCYDASVLQYVDFAEEAIVSDVFDDIEENNVVNGASGEVLWMGMNSLLENEISFTDEKTKLGEVRFTVKTDLPSGLNGVLSFDCPETFDFQFGDLDDPAASQPGIENARITSVFHNSVMLDTVPPVVTLDGGTQTRFYYSPVSVEISETNGLSGVFLNGEELSFPYLISKSGTLVVTDKPGNSTTLNIQIDDAAYLAAKEAIEKLPEAIDFGAEAFISTARTAANAVSDPTAKSKLDLARLEKAEAILNALQAEKIALVQEIANAKFTISLSAETAAAIEALDAKVQALSAKGAAFTDAELKNLTDAKTALAELQKRSETVHLALAELPSAENILWNLRKPVEQLKSEVAALKALQDSFTAEEEAKLAQAEKALVSIASLKQAAEADIQIILGTDTSPALVTQINAVQEMLVRLTEKGVSLDEVKDADKFAAAAETVSAMLRKIQFVTAQINALPTAEQLVFQDESAVHAAAEALKKLQAENLDVTAETRTKLTAAQQELSRLKSARAALTQQFSGTELTVDLTKESAEAIEALRKNADALNQKGAAFTPEELQALTAAEARLSDLQSRSRGVHQAIADLPEKDQVVLQHKQQLDKIRQEMAELSVLGDVFTESELQKLARVEAALNELEAAGKSDSQEETLPAQPDSTSETVPIETEKRPAAQKKPARPASAAAENEADAESSPALQEQAQQPQAPAPTSAPAETPAPDAPASSGAQPEQGEKLPVWPALAALLAFCAAAVFFVLRMKKK